MERVFFVLFCLVGVVSPALAANVQGTVLLENQTNHSGTVVTLNEVFVTPALSLGGILILLAVVGFLFTRRYRKAAVTVGIAGMVVLALAVSHASPRYSAMTGSDGSYSFSDVLPGTYTLSAAHDCYISSGPDILEVTNGTVTAGTVTLLSAPEYNEALMPINLHMLKEAQIEYNNNSSPHTYTGSLDCLTSGNGAGGVPLLPADFADGLIDGYQISMIVTTPDAVGSYWFWSATAMPVQYDCTGIQSYYIDESVGCPGCMIQHADLGGGIPDENLPYPCTGDQPENARRSMSQLINSQTDNFNNTSPHTYASNMSELQLIFGVENLCPELVDSEMCGYQYALTAGDEVLPGSFWAWSCTAWPIMYGGDTVMTFYVDESEVIRGADTGGLPGDTSLPDIGAIPDVCE